VVAVSPTTHTLYIADTSNNDAAAVLNLAKGGFGPGPGSPSSPFSKGTRLGPPQRKLPH
jgi:hypothetical protein